MFATRVLRQAAAHAERTPLIRFIGKRSVPGMSPIFPLHMLRSKQKFNLGFQPPRTQQITQHLPTFLPTYQLRTNTHTEHVDHTPQPHPASPTGSLPSSIGGNSHTSFSSYRDHAQQHGPLRKTIGVGAGIGTQSAAHLGPVDAPNGVFFDRNQLPARFRRAPLTAAEIEAVETGGAALFG